MTRTDVTLPWSGSKDRITFLRHSNAVSLFILSSHMISLTNTNAVLPRARINFLRHRNIVLLFSHMISVTNVNTVHCDVESIFGLWKSFTGGFRRFTYNEADTAVSFRSPHGAIPRK